LAVYIQQIHDFQSTKCEEEWVINKNLL
jgi:hypothetical protein